MSSRVNSLLIGALTRLQREEKGQALTEYALVLGVIVIGIVVSMAALKTGIADKVTSLVSSLASAG